MKLQEVRMIKLLTTKGSEGGKMASLSICWSIC